MRGYNTIMEWAVDELGLTGNSLIIYSCIYGFSQDGESYFTGKTSYIAHWAGCTERTAFRILNSLVDKGIIEKAEIVIDGKKTTGYRATAVIKNSTDKMSVDEINQNFTDKITDKITDKMSVGEEKNGVVCKDTDKMSVKTNEPNSASTVDRTPNRYSYTPNDTMEVDNTLESNNNYYSIFSNNKKENQVKEKSNVSVDDEKIKVSPPKSRASEEKARVDGIAQQVLDYLNGKTGENFKLRGTVKPYAHEGLIKRIKEGYKLEHFITIIDTKCAEWQGTEQAKYLTPETLFRPCHMENYLDSQKQKETPTAPPAPKDTTVFIQDLVEYPLGSGNYMPRWERDELIAKENGNNGG